MQVVMNILAFLVLIAIQLFMGFVFSDYLIEHGLSPKETKLVSAMAQACYLLGILVMAGIAKFSKKKEDKTP